MCTASVSTRALWQHGVHSGVVVGMALAAAANGDSGDSLSGGHPRGCSVSGTVDEQPPFISQHSLSLKLPPCLPTAGGATSLQQAAGSAPRASAVLQRLARTAPSPSPPPAAPEARPSPPAAAAASPRGGGLAQPAAQSAAPATVQEAAAKLLQKIMTAAVQRSSGEGGSGGTSAVVSVCCRKLTGGGAGVFVSRTAVPGRARSPSTAKSGRKQCLQSAHVAPLLPTCPRTASLQPSTACRHAPCCALLTCFARCPRCCACCGAGGAGRCPWWGQGAAGHPLQLSLDRLPRTGDPVGTAPCWACCACGALCPARTLGQCAVPRGVLSVVEVCSTLVGTRL